MQSLSALWESGQRSGSPSWITHHAMQLLSAERPASCSVSNRGSSRAFGRWDPREFEELFQSTAWSSGLWAGTTPFSTNSVSTVCLKVSFMGSFPINCTSPTSFFFVIVPFATRGLSTITASSVPPIGHTPHPAKREGGGSKSCLCTMHASVLVRSSGCVVFRRCSPNQCIKGYCMYLMSFVQCRKCDED